MVCELERMLRECDVFFCSISMTYDSAVHSDSAVTVVAQTSYFMCASYFDRKPMK